MDAISMQIKILRCKMNQKANLVMQKALEGSIFITSKFAGHWYFLTFLDKRVHLSHSFDFCFSPAIEHGACGRRSWRVNLKRWKRTPSKMIVFLDTILTSQPWHWPTTATKTHALYKNEHHICGSKEIKFTIATAPYLIQVILGHQCCKNKRWWFPTHETDIQVL